MSWGGRKTARLLALVIATYGARCWLCGLPIQLWRRYPDPLSATVDHKLPRSKGGTDELTNLRPAHRRCNLSRGNRDPAGSVRSGFRHSALARLAAFLGHLAPLGSPAPPSASL